MFKFVIFAYNTIYYVVFHTNTHVCKMKGSGIEGTHCLVSFKAPQVDTLQLVFFNHAGSI